MLDILVLYLGCFFFLWEISLLFSIKAVHKFTFTPTIHFLLGESHGKRSLVGFSPWGLKELDMTEWLTLFTSQQIWDNISLLSWFAFSWWLVTLSTLLNLIFILYWIIASIQCCISFRCTAKWFRYTHIHIFFFSDSFPHRL